MNKFEFDQAKLAVFLPKAQQQVTALEQGLNLIAQSGFSNQVGINKNYNNEQHVSLANYRLWSDFLNGQLFSSVMFIRTFRAVNRIFEQGVTQVEADLIAKRLNNQLADAESIVKSLAQALAKTSFTATIKIPANIKLNDDNGTAMQDFEIIRDFVLAIIWLSGKTVERDQLTEIEKQIRYSANELDLDEQFGITISTAQNRNATIKVSKEVLNILNAALK